ncbi:GlxA family transcriptional regulator, partial [Cribrihabitans sp. XS_ASV171]
TGGFLMAQAGLLSGLRATVHYEHIDAFRELYPETEVTEDLYVRDGMRVTCCGGVAATDCALHLLQGVAGASLANAAARYIFHPELRAGAMPQNPDDREPLGPSVPLPVRRAIREMEANLEQPLRIPEICGRISLSHRQLDRLFHRHIGKTPALYYRDIRLDRARGLVTQTDMPMSEIAVASGFANQVHFSRAYRERFGLPPMKDRTEGRIPFEFRAWPLHARHPRDPDGR